MNLDAARALMHEWVTSPSLRTHMESVGACMRAYAQRLDPSRETAWHVAGLLHDFDYERHPTAEEHPVVGVRHLDSLGVEREILDAILGHAAERTGVARVTPMAKALFACDELAGFIVACGKVRPEGLASLEARSVRKKLKDKAFAAAVSREDIAQGHGELASLTGLDEDNHIALCIGAIRDHMATHA
ncbi:MAG: HAD family hydrolase [Phycisphaerales bacterium]|nr:HAD family hydrolase [Phycisphaerales bacterium]